MSVVVRDPLSEQFGVPGWPVTGGDAILRAYGVPISEMTLQEDEDTVMLVMRTDDPARPLRLRVWPKATAPSLDILAQDAAAWWRRVRNGGAA